MRDLIIVLPGIMGSVLRRDDGDGDGPKDLWNPGLGMARNLLRSRSWVDSLVLHNDDPENPGFADGVIPTGLAKSTAVVPGLVEIDGYSELHDALDEAFGNDLIEGDALNPTVRSDRRDPAVLGYPNYYRFAYDWRRDLRASALRLHLLIEEALGNLRAQRSPDAKVIFIAHSMGGLLARTYIEGRDPRTGEDFEGWRNVRELFTMGTPYRGAPVATSHLVEGYRKLFVNLSEALRSFTGVYQLLPRYRAILDSRTVTAGAPWIYPHELTGVPDFDAGRARAAYDLHLEIENGVERHRSDPDYRRTYCVPLLGFGHSTINSAELTDDGLTVSDRLPDYLPPDLSGGDGTVPLVSAIPLEYDNDRATLRYINQQHGSLQTDKRVLAAEIALRIRQLQAGSDAARAVPPGENEMPSLNLEHLRFWLEGDSAGTEGGAAEIGTVKPELLRLTMAGVEDDATANVTVTNLETGAAETAKGVGSGQELPLPRLAGDYRVRAVCPSAQLSSTSAFTVLPTERAEPED